MPKRVQYAPKMIRELREDLSQHKYLPLTGFRNVYASGSCGRAALISALNAQGAGVEDIAKIRITYNPL